MALIPKTAVLQLRLSPELLARFQASCDARDDSASHVLRQFIHREIEVYELHLLKKRLKAAEAASTPPPPSDTFKLEKSPPDHVKTLSGGKNREQRRADKKRGL